MKHFTKKLSYPLQNRVYMPCSMVGKCFWVIWDSNLRPKDRRKPLVNNNDQKFAFSMSIIKSPHKRHYKRERNVHTDAFFTVRCQVPLDTKYFLVA